MSVSDIATGRNVVCVGMYNNRSSVPVKDIQGFYTVQGSLYSEEIGRAHV